MAYPLRNVLEFLLSRGIPPDSTRRRPSCSWDTQIRSKRWATKSSPPPYARCRVSTACWWSITRRRKRRGLRKCLRSARSTRYFLLGADLLTELRIKEVARYAVGGYVYYVSLRGVTGAANLDVSEVARKNCRRSARISNCRSASCFGIRDAQTARAVARDCRCRGHRQPAGAGNRVERARARTGQYLEIGQGYPQCARPVHPPAVSSRKQGLMP